MAKDKRPEASEDEMSPEMKADMLARIAEIRALCVGNADDGFSGEDHDRVLYRTDWYDEPSDT